MDPPAAPGGGTRGDDDGPAPVNRNCPVRCVNVDTSRGCRAAHVARGAIPLALASALMYQTFVAGWDSYGARLAWMSITYLLATSC